MKQFFYLLLIIIPTIGFSQQNSTKNVQLKNSKLTASKPIGVSGTSTKTSNNEGGNGNTYPMTIIPENTNPTPPETTTPASEEINKEDGFLIEGV